MKFLSLKISRLGNFPIPDIEKNFPDFENPTSEDSDTSALDNEDLSFHLATFEKSGKLGPLLKALKNSLMAVQGTSTECERSFSTSGLIVTPMRTRIKFDLFNAVLF